MPALQVLAGNAYVGHVFGGARSLLESLRGDRDGRVRGCMARHVLAAAGHAVQVPLPAEWHEL